MVAAGAGALLATGLGATPSPAAASSTTLSPGRVESIPTPSITMVPGGPIMGPHVAGKVTGVAWVTSVDAGGRTLTAAGGHRLVVFSLQLTQPVADVGPMAPAWATVSASVTQGNGAWPVDLGPIESQIEAASGPTGTGRATYVFSTGVPAPATVLTLTDDGITQQYELTSLRPDGSDAWDRSTTPQTVVAPGTTSTVTLTAQDGFSQPSTVTLAWATLSPFTVDDPGQPPGLQPAGTPPPDGFAPSAVQPGPGADEEVLDVALGSVHPDPPYGQPGWGHFLAGLQPLPPSAVTFTGTADGTAGAPISAQVVNAVAPADQTGAGNDDGMLDAIYRFVVPADVSGGTIRIAPATTTGTEYTGFEGNGTTAVSEPGTVAGTLTFPTAPPPTSTSVPWARLLVPTPVDGVPPAGLVSGGAPIHRGGADWWLVLPAIPGLAVLAVVVRRHRRRPRLAPSGSAPGVDLPVPPSGTGAGDMPTTATTVDASASVPPPPPDPPAAPEPAPGPAAEEVAPPAFGEPGDLVVRVLGTVEVEGWVQPPQRRDAVELCCFLALHDDRARRTEELVVALGSGDVDGGDRSPKTLMNALSALRRSVGAQRLPDATTAGGYRLHHATSDWGTFRALAAAADEAHRRGDHDAAVEHRRHALALVRGRPFDGVPDGQYRWAYAEHLVTDMTAAIVDVAHRLGSDLLGHGQPAEAREVARLGLRASPDDSVLWEDLARAVEAGGEPDATARFWRSARVALGDPAVTELRSRVSVTADP